MYPHETCLFENSFWLKLHWQTLRKSCNILTLLDIGGSSELIIDFYRLKMYSLNFQSQQHYFLPHRQNFLEHINFNFGSQDSLHFASCVNCEIVFGRKSLLHSQWIRPCSIPLIRFFRENNNLKVTFWLYWTKESSVQFILFTFETCFTYTALMDGVNIRSCFLHNAHFFV